jgi:hypothetical protein
VTGEVWRREEEEESSGVVGGGQRPRLLKAEALAHIDGRRRMPGVAACRGRVAIGLRMTPQELTAL